MFKPQWHCREFGNEGFVFIAVDQMMPSGTMVGLRHAVHPFMLKQTVDPQAVFMGIIEELAEALGRAIAQPDSTSRACAFGD